MGAFHIQLAKLKGARVIVCEVDEDRLALAEKLGADIVINSAKTDAIARVKELTDGRGADVVFCTAALPKLADDAIKMAGKFGRVVMYSSFPANKPVELDVNAVHSSEINITGALNSNLSEFMAATRLLSFKMIDPSLLVTETVPFEKITYAFERAIDPKTYRIVVKM
jgi:L-iditol 2-dehydrogenase